MFNLIFQKKLRVSNLYQDMIDIHSHILYGVDDGAENFELSNALIDKYISMGITKIFLTPHSKLAIPNISSEFLTKRYNTLKEKIGGKVELKLASEYMLDGSFADRLKRNDFLTYNDGYILVETYRRQPTLNFFDYIYELQLKGYTPILAHPERYLVNTIDDLKSFKDKGVLFQLNITSLSGYYGPVIKKRALFFLDNGCYDFAGSDLHDESQLKFMTSLSLNKKRYAELKRIINNNNTLW